MKIDGDTLEKLERLSLLKIDDAHKEEVINSIEEILGFVENLNSVDISQVDATFTTLSGGTPMREDEIVNANITQEVLAKSPNSEGDYFIVPKIIE